MTLRQFIPWLLVGIGLLVYANSLSGEWMFDDYSCIPENAHIRSLWPLWRSMSAPRSDIALAGRPLVSLSFALNYAVGGLDVRGYHAVNVVLHLIAGLLLYGLLRRTLTSQRRLDRFADSAEEFAFIIALVWLVHPLQTESVCYIAQRTELCMAVAYLSTLYGLARAATSRAGRRWELFAVLSCVLGMASKEVMVSAPVVAIMYERWFWPRPWRQRWLCYTGLATSWIVLATLLVSGSRSQTTGFHLGISPIDYARTQAGVLCHYLRLTAWPSPLVLDYADWALVPTWRQATPAVAVVAMLMGLTAWALWRRRMLGFAGVWFFAILAPTSSIVPITDCIFEHRMYLPSAAPAALVVFGVWELLRRSGWNMRQQRIIGSVVAVVSVLALSAVTARRNRDYQTEIGMWSDVVTKRPNNSRAHYNLGIALAEQGRLDEAVAHFVRVIQLKPGSTDARNNLAVISIRGGNPQYAIAQCTKALQLQPDRAELHNTLGHALAERGQFNEAVGEFREALRLDPDFLQARTNLEQAQLRRRAGQQAALLVEEGSRLAP